MPDTRALPWGLHILHQYQRTTEGPSSGPAPSAGEPARSSGDLKREPSREALERRADDAAGGAAARGEALS